MPLAKASNPLFYRVQIVAERSALAHFPLAPLLRFRRDDTVFVDIQSKIEFFFHWVCFACSLLFKLQRSGNTCVPAVGAALLHLKSRVAREKYERQTHPSFQPLACALTSRPQP